MRDLTRDEAEMVGLDGVYGIYVDEVIAGSPAELGGIERDDVLIGFNGAKIINSRDFQLKVAAADEGDEVSLELLRRGRPRELRVVLGDLDRQLLPTSSGQYQSEPENPRITEGVSSQWLGMHVADCSPELADRFGVDYHDGVIVVKVEPGSPADVKGIVPGTIIMEVNYESILDKDDFEEVAGELKERELAIAFHVLDTSGRIEYVAIKPR
jgi:serine protease Do